MNRYLVVTPEYGTVVPVTDDGQGPLEYGADVFDVEAESARDAKVMALRHWRKNGSEWIDMCYPANPFTGVKVIRYEPCKVCGGYCDGCES